MSNPPQAVQRLATGIAGFDQLALGGLPAGRTTLVSGNTGAGKTLFAAEFLAHGIMEFDDPGVFVTFEERPADIRHNLASFGFDIGEWESQGKWLFVDASGTPPQDEEMVGAFDFGGLISRITGAVQRIGAKRVSFDSLGAVFSRFQDAGTVRFELKRLSEALTDLQVTTVLTAERVQERETISRFGVEEFVTDNIVVLSNALERDKRRRTIEVLKFRGASHRTGEWLFAIDAGRGIVVLPVSVVTTSQRASDARVTSGLAELDRMCDGGFYRDTVAFVSGATGTGKTLLATHFATVGPTAAPEGRCLYFSFEESRDQFMRNTASWGFHIEAMEAAGQLLLRCEYPELASLEDHFLTIMKAIESSEPHRLVIDNVSALERVATVRGIRDFVIGLGAAVKEKQITTLFTGASSGLLGPASLTEVHMSALTDVIIALRQVQVDAEMRRSLVVLKMRGSRHDTHVREFSMDDQGMRIEGPFVSDPLAAQRTGPPSDGPTLLHPVTDDERNG